MMAAIHGDFEGWTDLDHFKPQISLMTVSLALGDRLRVLISFNFEDDGWEETFRASLFMLEPDLEYILSPVSYGAVSLRDVIANGIFEADAFLLLVGPKGISRWQEIECEIALDRNAHDSSFVVVPVLAARGQAPNLALLRDLNWFNAPVVTDRTMLRRLIGALKSKAPS
jgi:hypothetical protein